MTEFKRGVSTNNPESITVKGDGECIHNIALACLDILEGTTRMTSVNIPAEGKRATRLTLMRTEEEVTPHPLVSPRRRKK